MRSLLARVPSSASIFFCAVRVIIERSKGKGERIRMSVDKGGSSAEGRTRLTAAFLKCRATLRGVVGRIVKPHDIDDILQETFIRAYAAVEKTEIRNPRSFMLTTARNLALNHVTNAHSRLTQVEDFSSSEVLGMTASLESEFESKERFLVFCRAVRDLPAQCRKVFVLKKVYGLSQQEIAEYLDISESTVEKHVAKGLLLSRDAMRTMGYPLDDAGGRPRRTRSAALGATDE